MEIFARLSRGDHFKAAMGPSSFNRRLLAEVQEWLFRAGWALFWPKDNSTLTDYFDSPQEQRRDSPDEEVKRRTVDVGIGHSFCSHLPTTR